MKIPRIRPRERFFDFMASNSTPSPSPSEPAPESVGRRISKRLEAVKRVLQSDIGDVRKTIQELLKKEEVMDELVSDVPETAVSVKPTEKTPGIMDVQASQRIETGRTPRLTRNLLAFPEADKLDDKSLSEGFTEVLRRMSELVFVPNTNPIYAFMSQMFLQIRIRSDHVQQEKTFDQIFEEQISWYCEQHFLARRKVFSPALAFHWERYFQSAGAERYEDNLTGHNDPEIRLYGILMRSCLRMFDQYMKRVFPEGAASRPLSPTSEVLITDAEAVEGSRLRGHAMKVHSQHLLLDQGLSDYFEENLPRHLKTGLDEALPPGMDGIYLFDTNLFVSALIEKAEKGGTKGSLGSVLNAHALEEACGKITGIRGFFTLPSHEGHPERLSPRDIACKNLVLWKRIGDQRFYESLVRGESPEEPRDFDREVDFMGKTDVKYLAHRVIDALKDSSNIYEVFCKLFPDLDPTIFAQGLATGFFSERLKKLAVVTNMLLQDEKELAEMVSRFFGILSKGNLAVWNTPLAQLKNRTPFQYLKQKAVGVADARKAAGVDRGEEETAYESQWRFLNQPPEQAWDVRSSSYYSRIKRLSGWRTVQRNVRLKMIADLLQQMGWNFREHVLDEQDHDWWMTLDHNHSNEATRRQLTLPFLTSHGRLLVCRFPELQC